MEIGKRSLKRFDGFYLEPCTNLNRVHPRSNRFDRRPCVQVAFEVTYPSKYEKMMDVCAQVSLPFRPADTTNDEVVFQISKPKMNEKVYTRVLFLYYFRTFGD